MHTGLVWFVEIQALSQVLGFSLVFIFVLSRVAQNYYKDHQAHSWLYPNQGRYMCLLHKSDHNTPLAQILGCFLIQIPVPGKMHIPVPGLPGQTHLILFFFSSGS